MQIDGSRILVTGASSGIGAELAPQLAARGATVGIVARRRDRLEQVLERCREHAPDSRLWAADLGDLELAERVAIEAWDAFGGLDALVNNAAIPMRRDVRDITPEALAMVMDVNFHSPIRMGMALLPRMLEQGSGCIVNVSSMGGRLGIMHEAAYNAAKFAMCGWSEAMFMDLLDSPVAVKLVLPGPIETEIWDQPDNLPAPFKGPWVPAAECAASIVEAIAGDGFEYYVPEEVFGRSQRDMVVRKSESVDTTLRGYAAYAAGA